MENLGISGSDSSHRILAIVDHRPTGAKQYFPRSLSSHSGLQRRSQLAASRLKKQSTS